MEQPSLGQQKRIVKSAIHQYEKEFLESIYNQLKSETRRCLSNLLESREEITYSTLWGLKEDSGSAGVDNFAYELEKLKVIEQLQLTVDLFEKVPERLLKTYKSRVATELIGNLRQQPENSSCALIALYCWQRRREILDGLVEQMLQIIHKMNTRAKHRVSITILKEIQKIQGKEAILYKMVEATLQQPDGLVREVIYPVVGENILKAIAQECNLKEIGYHNCIQIQASTLYKHHYRRMLPGFLAALEFQSNNPHHYPLIKALEYLKNPAKTSQRYIPFGDVPFDMVISKKTRLSLVETDSKGRTKINRINYEVAILRSLRKRLRCKEVWVSVAHRYGNPDSDLPKDFETNRADYYQALNLSLDADTFIKDIQATMHQELIQFNNTLPINPYVSLRKKGKKRIRLKPLDAQPEPVFLNYLKAQIAVQWLMTRLIDIFKEANNRIRFTTSFKGVGKRVGIEDTDLEKRLLLCLYGLGTNTGLKRVLSNNQEYIYDDLLYAKRRYINKDSLRVSISKVANAIFRIRKPHIWGEGTTACASDAKSFGAWDQNLLTEWHVRHKGRSVMVYWHVEQKSVCIYSQLKRCSSSEVAAMIQGVLRHCTEMAVQKQYVDSRGQSEVVFAFCHLLGFDLMPRLKAIATQKLALPLKENCQDYSNLRDILKKPINWKLIRQQYDPMVKYVSALKKGTANAESILSRFTRNNLQHPTYKAFSELGKAIKTIFLCRYLSSEALRIEIHQGLNVVENWNSANSFIFFGKSGEISSNQFDDQKISVLCLHLLQISLVYINTLMIQEILSQPDWFERMTPEDLRALTPLIYAHVNPYGSFELNMFSLPFSFKNPS